MRTSGTRQSPLASPVGGEFGERIRTERMAGGYSLADLAQRIEVTKGYLSRLELGKAKPAPVMIDRIAKALSIDPSPLHVLAGYLPTDVKQILYRHPVEAPEMLRETFGEYEVNRESTEQGRNGQQPVVRTAEHGHTVTKRKDLYEVVYGDCSDWLGHRAPNSVHAVVTDPPYGLK